MKQTEPSELTDQELLAEAKKVKSSSIIYAGLIGLSIGVIVYGVAKNTLGFFGLIFIVGIFWVFSNSKSNKAKALYNKAVEAELAARNLP